MNVFVVEEKSVMGELALVHFKNFDDALRFVIETKLHFGTTYSKKEIEDIALSHVSEFIVNESFTQAMIG